MKNNKMETKDLLKASEDESRYGLPVTAKVPAIFKHQLGEEAQARGISLAQHVAALLMSNHQHLDIEKTKTELLLKERNMLQKRVEELENRQLQFSEKEWKQLLQLQKNRMLLKQLHASGLPVDREQLKSLGFDFSLLVGITERGGKKYGVLFDMCFSLGTDKIDIQPFT